MGFKFAETAGEIVEADLGLCPMIESYHLSGEADRIYAMLLRYYAKESAWDGLHLPQKQIVASHLRMRTARHAVLLAGMVMEVKQGLRRPDDAEYREAIRDAPIPLAELMKQSMADFVPTDILREVGIEP